MTQDEPGERTPGATTQPAARRRPAADAGHTGVTYSPTARPDAGGRAARTVQRLVERLAVLTFRSASWLIGHIPLAIADPAARGAYRIGYLAWPKKRRIILANAARVLGRPEDDPATARLAKAIYASYARFTLELMRLPHAPADEPLRLLPAEGPGHETMMATWERCRSEGRGVIAVSGHIGSIDVFAGAYALRGLPTYGLADDTAFPELFELLNRQRRRWGLTIIPWRNLREIFRIMRAPCVLGMVVDWGYRPDDLPVRLFGRWTTLPAGPATLAARSRATILPVASIRQPDGRYRSSTGDPIEVSDGSPAELLRATQAIADALERLVQPDPRQWFAFKPLWPATPDEERALEARAREMAGG